ncbi:hypothetical protein [Tropicimonas sp. IMCC6043]|uniref:hypothetical protein n=1 Tax=Tropicimonas sp. IMCC6043 TaxID=2510645 RepID=UPI00101CEFDB|nr:hypothetical protein [Tropicimonas sp. IMCC6043]RYH07785.1 hypothetical protein EU800_18860 [Tropicimonas sp. IMCC6043]
MTEDTINDKRGPDGRFLPGNRPPRSTGRPPGSNGVNARAAHLANECLETMLGKAADVIDAALDEGDSHVATWLIDRIRPPKTADFVRIDIASDLETPREAVEAAREAILAAGRGEVSMSEAKAYVALLERLGGMLGYLELEQLKASLEELKASRDRPPLQLPEISRVQWGHGWVDRETG